MDTFVVYAANLDLKDAFRKRMFRHNTVEAFIASVIEIKNGG